MGCFRPGLLAPKVHMRDLVVGCCVRRSPACFSSKLSATVAVAVLAIGATACPQITNFGVYAQNSATLRDRAALSGGDVGVSMKGTGPLLVTGYELALVIGAQVDATHNTIANRVLLQGAKVGDVQTNALTVQNGGTYAKKYGFPTTMPALPTLAPVFPGTAALTVNPSSTVVASPGAYGAVSIGTKGILRLSGGVYHVASLQLDDDARIEAQAAVQLRVAGRVTGRLSTLARVFVGAAAGATLAAGDIRIEVSGKNGTGGGLTETPKAATFGNDASILGVILAPNGTLQMGQRNIVTGALVGRDVYVDIDSKVNLQSGVAVLKCAQFCNDGNPCTKDTCTGEVCSYPAAASGTSCSDGNTCNGAETCDGKGTCKAGTPVTCMALDQCHTTGVCDPATGVCSNPTKSDGTSCNDANACTVSDICRSGVCSGTTYSCDDGLACTTDTCNGTGGCTHTVTAGNCAIDGACYAAGATNPAHACQQCTPATSQTAWSLKSNGTVCRAAAGACDKAEVCNGTSPACPPDALIPAATVCLASAGVCDVAETCTGTSAACPADGFVPPTTVCRASAGVCDVAETCTGASAACPLDGFLQASLACRPAVGACDAVEVCSGSSANCPADAFLPASTICRASTGTCDPAETCTGSDPTCPADVASSAPAAPTDLTAGAGSAGGWLTWTASPGVTSYNVLRAGGIEGIFVKIGSTDSTSYLDPGLTPGLTYYYVVTAVNTCGESAYTGQVSATSPPRPMPPRTLPKPPPTVGCYVGTWDGWQEVSCTTYDELDDSFKKPPVYNPSQSQPSINSVAYVDGGVNQRISFQFGQVESTIAMFTSEKDAYPPDPNTDGGVRYAKNSLSLQANTNVFKGSNGLNDWVQFVIMTEGDPNDSNHDKIDVCIWNVEFDVPVPGTDASSTDYWKKTQCVGGALGTAPDFKKIFKRQGDYKPLDFATIAGSVYYDYATSQNVLGVVAQVSWWDPNHPDVDPNNPSAYNSRGLYSIVLPDYYGLANNWTNLSGTLIGMCGGGTATFTDPSSVVTRLLAGSCANAPGPVPQIPWPGECPNEPLLLAHTDTTADPVTAETNNLNAQKSPVLTALNTDTVYMEYTASTAADGKCLSSTTPHVFVRDSIEDVGIVPSNIGDLPFWESPDIFLVPAGTKVAPDAESKETLVTENGYFDIWVRVNNDFGCSEVNNARALVYVADPSALNTGWIPVTNGEYWGSTANPYVGVKVPITGPAMLGPFTWHAPSVIAGDGHKCIIAAIQADDEIAVDPNDVWDAPGSYQVGQRNVQFSNCKYPLTNTSGSDGSLALVLTVKPTSVNPTLSGDTDIEVIFDDPDSTWYNVWVLQTGGHFKVTHDAAGTTNVRLGSNKVKLNSVTLVANDTRAAATKIVAHTSESHDVSATLGIQGTLTVGTTVVAHNGGSCRVTATPIVYNP